jgi:PAS domain S-box-containing protein
VWHNAHTQLRPWFLAGFVVDRVPPRFVAIQEAGQCSNWCRLMTGFYDFRLVSLSVLIAICAAFAALDLAGRTIATRGGTRLAWITGGAVAMGIGIWSMHYVGMLAFILPVPVLYDWPTVLLSLLAAVFAAAVALFVTSREHMSWAQAVVGSIFMGGGIATMHYTGMAAMRLTAMCSYYMPLFALSVVLAIAISLVALWLTFRFRGETKGSAGWKIGCAVVMGAAIPVMHYTGMAAARFTPTSVSLDTTHAVSTSTLGFVGVSFVTLLVLGVAVMTATVDRRLSQQRLQLFASERRYQLLVEGVKDYAIFMLTPDGHIGSWNPGAERIKGYRAEEIIGQHFSRFYPEEDAKNGKPAEQLKRAIDEGRFEDEGWRLRKDGSRFWADVVITPVLDNAGLLQGFSKVTRDISERKQAEENLRSLSGHLLQVQDEERRRMARELHDSAGQLVAAMGMNLARLADEASTINPRAMSLVKENQSLVDELSREIRTISHLLHPPLLDELGLAAALDTYVQGFTQRSKIKVDLQILDDFGRLNPDSETAIFRLVQECLTNIHRHSGSRVATIHISRSGDAVSVEVRDAGKGIAPERRAEMEATGNTGVGIRGMRERIRQLGGALDISSNASGTLVTARLPI